MKELIWILSKDYDSDIRTIQFIDPINSFEFVELDTSIQDITKDKAN